MPEHGMEKVKITKEKSKLEGEGDGSMFFGPKPNRDQGECVTLQGGAHSGVHAGAHDGCASTLATQDKF